MPNKASAKKRVRQNERRRVHNRAIRSEMRLTVKKVNNLVGTTTVDGLDVALQQAQSKLAKAAKRNIIKKNTLARRQSRLMKAANKARTAVAAPQS